MREYAPFDAVFFHTQNTRNILLALLCGVKCLQVRHGGNDGIKKKERVRAPKIFKRLNFARQKFFVVEFEICENHAERLV